MNRYSVSGYTYDAAGNALTDGINSYRYDAEGNLTQANTGSATFQTTYNALNQAVRFDYNSGAYFDESIYDAQGKFSANWSMGGNFNRAEAYWGATPIESYFGSPSQTAHFLLRDALGSMRFETNNTGAVTVNRYTLPFGDGTTAVSGSRNTNDGFAGMGDSPSGNHAQFRDYSNVTGRWLQPDPYDGSYDAGNPQSLNRYSYVLNNPLGFVDPTGLECQVNSTYGDIYDDGVGAACGSVDTTGGTYQVYAGGFGGVGGGGGGDGGGSVGGGGGQVGGTQTTGVYSTAPKNVGKILTCASELANNYSIAGVLGLTSDSFKNAHPTIASIGTGFLGNTFSGVTDFGTHLYNTGTQGGGGGAIATDLAVGGVSQGLPVGESALFKGAAGLAQDALVNVGEKGLADAFGFAKIGIDLAIYGASAIHCYNHP